MRLHILLAGTFVGVALIIALLAYAVMQSGAPYELECANGSCVNIPK